MITFEESVRQSPVRSEPAKLAVVIITCLVGFLKLNIPISMKKDKKKLRQKNCSKFEIRTDEISRDAHVEREMIAQTKNATKK